MSQRTDRAVSRFSSVISAVLPSLMTAKVIADDRGLVATVNSAAETLSLCLESAFEVLGACLSVCVAVPNEKYDSAVKQLVVITIESCGPRAVGALVAALQAMAGLYVRVPVSDINHAATLGAIPPQLEVYWRVMVALKRWLVYTGDRLITLLHNMLEPYIDFGPLGIEVVSNCVKLLLMISPLLPEPFLVVSERKEHGFDTMALSWREVFGSVAAALLRAWSEQDRDDLKEHRCV